MNINNLNNLPQVDHEELHLLMINMGASRTIMVWGDPGIGKSEHINNFGQEYNMPVQIMLGSQMSPEDLAVPLIDPARGVTRMCPPSILVSERPQLILIDEINGAEPDVMRAFFSLVQDRRIGEYHLPEDSIVVCAGNPTSHNSVARPVPAPLMNRMYHVRLKLKSTRGWLEWATQKGLHPLIIQFIRESGLSALNPGRIPGDDEIFTTPRSWEVASDSLMAWQIPSDKEMFSPEEAGKLSRILQGAVAAREAEEFTSWLRRRSQGITLSGILAGEKFPDPKEDYALAAHLVELLRNRLIRELPREEGDLGHETKELSKNARRVLTQLALSAPELQTGVITDEKMPIWFLESLQTDLSKVMN